MSSPTFVDNLTSQIGGAADSGLSVLNDPVTATGLFALPLAWIAYKVVRKVIGKIG
jgi:hypothetical protein